MSSSTASSSQHKKKSKRKRLDFFIGDNPKERELKGRIRVEVLESDFDNIDRPFLRSLHRVLDWNDISHIGGDYQLGMKWSSMYVNYIDGRSIEYVPSKSFLDKTIQYQKDRKPFIGRFYYYAIQESKH